jgi:hypothetical protein
MQNCKGLQHAGLYKTCRIISDMQDCKDIQDCIEHARLIRKCSIVKNMRIVKDIQYY